MPDDKVEARVLRTRSAHYTLIGDQLYRRGFSAPLLRCVTSEEADYIMREIHEGIYGNHTAARSFANKVVRQRYYWPWIQDDAYNFVKRCDKCQRFASIPRAPPHELITMTSPWPFSMWGIDLIGPMLVGKGGVKYVVVVVDYFTKWVEAEPLAAITTRKLKDFVFKNIVCRFGIPHTLISDNGKQFDNEECKQFCNELDIQKKFALVCKSDKQKGYLAAVCYFIRCRGGNKLPKSQRKP